MLFKNIGEKRKIKVKDRSRPLGFRFQTVKEDEIVDIPYSVGIAYNFQAESVEVVMDVTLEEVKADSFDKEYYDKLVSIKGLGKKTAKDIMQIYVSEKDLKNAIKQKVELPIRDDLIKPIKKKFGGFFS